MRPSQGLGLGWPTARDGVDDSMVFAVSLSNSSEALGVDILYKHKF